MTDFFKQLDPLLAGCNLQLKFFRKNDKITLSIIPEVTNAKKKEDPVLSPITITGTPQELDEGFFETISAPMQKAAGLITNLDKVEKELSDLDKKVKDKTTKKEEKKKQPEKKSTPAKSKSSPSKSSKPVAKKAAVKKETPKPAEKKQVPAKKSASVSNKPASVPKKEEIVSETPNAVPTQELASPAEEIKTTSSTEEIMDVPFEENASKNKEPNLFA